MLLFFLLSPPPPLSPTKQHLILVQLRRRNLTSLQTKLQALAAVSQTQSSIQLLMATADYVGALELIATAKLVLRTELENLHCVRYGNRLFFPLLSIMASVFFYKKTELFP